MNFIPEKKEVRQMILDNWEKMDSIGKRRKILAWLIRLFPGGYPFLYNIYARQFQTSPYEYNEVS